MKQFLLALAIGLAMALPMICWGNASPKGLHETRPVIVHRVNAPSKMTTKRHHHKKHRFHHHKHIVH